MNRLNLNFGIEDDKGRAEFVQGYLTETDEDFTSAELEKIADYLLWGKNPEGLSSNKTSGIELKNSYDSHQALSLDELTESPTFDENSIRPLGAVPYKTPKQKFSRELARKNAPSYILELLEPLWREIDETELQLLSYEVRTGKKEKIRPDLLERFTPEEVKTLEERSKSLTPYAYLKMRRSLVEKRREQFTLQDFYQSKPSRFIPHIYNERTQAFFDADIPVLPLGLKGASSLSDVLFPKNKFPDPNALKPSEARALSTLIWTPKESQLYFDFRDPSHLLELLKLWDDLNLELEELPFGSTLRALIETFEYYKGLAPLTPIESEVLALKVAHNQNQPIAEYINKKYDKTYNSNYISTIFHKKALKKIGETASLHQSYVENLFFPENFKYCRDCGELFLLDSRNFMRRKSSKDGFSCRCKRCDSALRYKKKEEKNGQQK